MRRSVAEPLLAQLSELVATHLGLHFPPERWHDLERHIEAIARELAFLDTAACLQWLTTLPWTQKQIAVLARHLTVGETYFFREPKTFQLLQERLLPTLLHTRRGTAQRLHFWSAGCATGEEPYSIAILLHTLIPDLKNWHITLLATDINRRSLAKAAEGVYDAWSLRNTPLWIRDRYFRKQRDGRYEVRAEVKSLVTFAPFNLVAGTDMVPRCHNHVMDAIFCRNVLMYFAPAQADRVAHRLYQALAPGGWLFVSPSELSPMRFAAFATVSFPDAILYRRAHQQCQTAEGVLARGPLRVPPTATASRAHLPQRASPRPTTPLAASTTKTTPMPLSRPDMPVAAPSGRGDEAEPAAPHVALGTHQQEAAADMAGRARSCANQGHLKAARVWVEQAIAIDKLNARLHYLRAIILQEQGHLDTAITSLKRALSLDQSLVLAHVVLGNLTLRQQRHQSAVKHFENALALLHPHQPEVGLPEAAGLTAARLRSIIRSLISREKWT